MLNCYGDTVRLPQNDLAGAVVEAAPAARRTLVGRVAEPNQRTRERIRTLFVITS